MERCPVCRARLSAPQCRRCGADFSRAFTVATQARQIAIEALRLWRQGHHETAAKRLHHSLVLYRDPFRAKLLDHWLDRQVRQAVQALARDEPDEARRLCARVLALKPHPLARSLRDFTAKRGRQGVYREMT